MKTCTVCGAEWEDDTKFCPNDGSTLRSAEGADLIGSIIGGNYHIGKKLGEGGMGAVYLGEHVKMGRKSAIKVMTQAMANNPEAIARFNREATNAARINHPNVCAIYDFGETPDGTIFLAMEFIEGETLGDLLAAAGGPLPLDRAANILDQTADALRAAHDLGIVHRDLKPDNIMIAKSRGKDLVKVVDFGIAKAMGGDEGQKVTKTGLVIGTPEYMSPEQLSGDVLDGRSDVYSLALVFFRVITGTLPFPAESAQETMIKRLTDDPLTLEQALPGGNFPPALQAVMDNALQRMPGDRFRHATELSAGVRSAIGGAGASGADRPTVDTEGATQILEPAGVTAQLQVTAVTPVQPRPVPGAEVTEPRKPPPPAPAPSPRRRPQK
ncbi:MAG: serine/threonine-protein kinase, partial [Gemmatimonadales bacterium]